MASRRHPAYYKALNNTAKNLVAFVIKSLHKSQQRIYNFIDFFAEFVAKVFFACFLNLTSTIDPMLITSLPMVTLNHSTRSPHALLVLRALVLLGTAFGV